MSAHDRNNQALTNKNLAALEEQCSSENPLPCELLGELYTLKGREQQNLLRARQYFSIACERQVAKACYNLAVTIGMLDKPSREEKREMYRYYVQGCQFEHGEACLRAAHLASDGTGTKKSLSGAVELLNEACKFNNSDGCYNFGVMLDQGIGIPVSKKDARAAYIKSCSATRPEGCFNAAWMMHEGEGGEKDLESSERYYRQACDWKLGNACTNLAYLLSERDGLALDDPKMATLFDTACKNGDDSACVEK